MKKNYILKSLIVTLCCLFTSVSARAEVLATTDAPSITTSVDDQSFITFTLVTGEKLEQVINVKAQSLTEDITITCDGYGFDANYNSIQLTEEKFKLSTQTISKEEAMSAQGYDLTYTINASKKGEIFIVDVTLTSGSVAKPISFYWSVSDAIIVKDLASLRQQDDELNLYFIESEIGVSYSSAEEVYVQDATAGARIPRNSIEESDYQRGDHYINILTEIYWENQLYIFPGRQEATSKKEVKPIMVTLSELFANPSRYESCLVYIENVNFGTAAGGTFATETVDATQGENTIHVNTFEGSDLIGTTIPETADIVGVIINNTATKISLRDTNDLLAPNAIDEIAISNHVWVAGNTLFVEAEAPVDVVVFDLLGKQIVAQNAVESAEFDLPAGVYVVKVDNKATKVIVK